MTKITFTSLFILLMFVAHAQGKKQSADRLKDDAEFFTLEGEHEKAYQTYKELINLDPKNYFYKFQCGLSALNLPFRKAETIDIFEDIIKTPVKDKLDLTSYLGKQYESIPVYYLGRAYHSNYKFEESIKYFNDFLATRPADLKIKDEVQHYLHFSESAKEIVEKPTRVSIRNLGAPLNSSSHEYVPLITADESMMIFTYRGPKCIGGLMNLEGKPNKNGIYFEDIYFSKRINDTLWGEPQSIGSEINSKQHDACIAISADGQDLYTYRSDLKDGGDIFVCHLKGDKWSAPERLNSNINTSLWEGSCSVTADGKYFYFASERAGGVGGRDIYVSEKMKSGIWGPAKNLRAINTKYDDDAPFIHADGKTLFFSSEGHNSIGGYDIFYSSLDSGKWSSPVNMGYPLNTTDDDRYYVISAKGDKGYFSSNRNSKGGDGSQDIYSVKPGWYAGKQNPLIMIVGSIYGNDTLMEACIEVLNKNSGEVIGPFCSNATTGKYIVTLPSHESYTFKVTAPEYPEYKEDMDADQLSTFLEVNKDFHLAKANFIELHTDTLKKLNDFVPHTSAADTSAKVVSNNITANNNTSTVNNTVSVNPCDEFKTLDFSSLKGKSLNDPKVYAVLLEIGNKICASSMEFKVQVGAYKKPLNFNSKHLNKFGKIESNLSADGLTRFTQGKCTNVNEAEQLRKKIIAAGQKDAWIVGFIDGKRFTLEELILVDFYNKNVAEYNENIDLLNDLLVTNP